MINTTQKYHNKSLLTMAKQKENNELSELSTKACINYFRLSSLFFKNDDIYNVNEIPESNEFHKLAKDMAEELEIDWAKMSHEDSNRIVINLLADAYMAMNQGGGYEHKLQVTVVPKK